MSYIWHRDGGCCDCSVHFLDQKNHEEFERLKDKINDFGVMSVTPQKLQNGSVKKVYLKYLHKPSASNYKFMVLNMCDSCFNSDKNNLDLIRDNIYNQEKSFAESRDRDLTQVEKLKDIKFLEILKSPPLKKDRVVVDD